MSLKLFKYKYADAFIKQNLVGSLYGYLPQLIHTFPLNGLLYMNIPSRIIYLNLKNFFSILWLLLTNKISIYLYKNGYLSYLYRRPSRKRRGYRLGNIRAIVLLGNITLNRYSRLVGSKTLLAFKGINALLDISLNAYPLLVNTQESLQAELYFIFLKFFVKSYNRFLLFRNYNLITLNYIRYIETFKKAI